MESIAYYDGKIGSPDELTVPFNDRSHFFGDGIYEASIGANGKVFAIEDHLDRFFTSAASISLFRKTTSTSCSTSCSPRSTTNQVSCIGRSHVV